MKRSFFLLTALAGVALAATPRLADARTSPAATHVRRSRTRRNASPGGCVSHRRTVRWASFTAVDFAP